MPRYSVQVPVTILVNFTVDAPDDDAAIRTNLDNLKREPVFQSFKGIDTDHADFSVAWIGHDGYDWERASAEPTDDPTTIFVDQEGTIYPDAAARDAALSADGD